MFLDGARTNFQDHADFAVSFALNHPREHFRLAFAQTNSFGTGIEWVVECHRLFLQLARNGRLRWPGLAAFIG